MSRSLRNPPCGMCVFKTNDLADRPLSKLFGMAQRPAGKLRHPLQPILVKTFPPLVSCFGADLVLLAQLAKIAGMNRFQHKLFSLVHRFYSFPRHSADYQNSRLPCVTYVLNHLCYRCIEPAPRTSFFSVKESFPMGC